MAAVTHDERLCVYPCYLNANKSVAEGRKVPRAAAADNPNTQEIFDCVAQGLKLPAEIERKRHPRDWMWLGRVRVALRGAGGELLNPDVPDRRTLYAKIAELVPRHPGRSVKARAAAAAAAGPSGGAALPPPPAAGGKKGGKKKK